MRTCLYCGKEFHPNHGNIKLCSYECRYQRLLVSNRHSQRRTIKARTRPYGLDPIPCTVCKETFLPKQSTHVICSDECRITKAKIMEARGCYYRRMGGLRLGLGEYGDED